MDVVIMVEPNTIVPIIARRVDSASSGASAEAK